MKVKIKLVVPLSEHEKTSLLKRIQKRTAYRKSTGCWLCKDLEKQLPKKRYSWFYFRRKNYQAHRLMYWLTRGTLDVSLEICHTCDETHCWNPTHIWQGSHACNMADASKKKRFPDRRGTGNNNLRLSFTNVTEIRKLHQTGKYTVTVLAKKFSVSAIHIRRLVNHEQRKNA